MVTIKPRYSEQIENGVLYFVARGKDHSERYGIRCGIKSTNSTKQASIRCL